MVMVDSSIWIDAFNGINSWQVRALSELLGKETIYLGDIILAEVLQGIRHEGDFENIKSELDKFPCANLLGKKMAIISAQNYRRLKNKGITVRKIVDVIIGTFCIENGFTLLHNDKDFLPMEKHLGLKTIRE